MKHLGDIFIGLIAAGVLALTIYAVVDFVRETNACKERGGVPVQAGQALQIICLDPKLTK